jgi:hypothetical protein
MSVFNNNRAAWGNAALVGAAWLAVTLAVAAVFNPKTVAAGWLVGFAFWSQVLLGALLLALIHRLTSGRWGDIIAPAVLPALTAIPWLLLLAIPLFIAIPALYPWFNGAAGIKTDVLSRYLNTPFFVVRSLIALGGWSALAILLPRATGVRGQLLAALGLVFHAIVISGIAIDWYLSLEAPFTSSSFGASVAVTQLTAAMAWAVALAPETDGDENTGDLGALLLAFILGITYIDFMAILVIWYGDLPREEIWFVERGEMPWPLIATIAFILVSVIPVFALMMSRLRASRTALRALGTIVLIGLALYDAYLIAPPFGAASLLWAALALIAIGLALVGWTASGARIFLIRERPSHAN